MDDEKTLAAQCLDLCRTQALQGRSYSFTMRLSTGFQFIMESQGFPAPAEKLANLPSFPPYLMNVPISSSIQLRSWLPKKLPSRLRRDFLRRSTFPSQSHNSPTASTTLPLPGDLTATSAESQQVNPPHLTLPSTLPPCSPLNTDPKRRVTKGRRLRRR